MGNDKISGMRNIVGVVDEQKKERFKILCRQKGCSVMDMVGQLVEEFVNDNSTEEEIRKEVGSDGIGTGVSGMEEQSGQPDKRVEGTKTKPEFIK